MEEDKIQTNSEPTAPEQPQVEINQEPTQPQGFEEQPKPEPEKKKTNWLLIIFFVLLLVLIGQYVYINYFASTEYELPIDDALPTEVQDIAN